MTIDKLYFDMDGVLADFDGGVMELCGMTLQRQGDFDPKRDEMLWDSVRSVPHFYDRIKPVPGGIELFMEMRRRYGERVEILTAVPKPHRNIPTAAEDKRNWVRRLISPDVVVHTVMREEKRALCKGPSTVLIDDFDKNIDAWREQGGTGILFLDAAQARSELERLDLC